MNSEQDLIQAIRDAYIKLAEKQSQAKVWHERASQAAEHTRQQTLAELAQAKASQLAQAEASYAGSLNSAAAAMGQVKQALGFRAGDWGDAGWQAWQAADGANFDLPLRIGTFKALGKWHTLNFPALVGLLGGQNLLIKPNTTTRTQAVGAVQGLLTRLLAAQAPGKVRFVFFDPVGLGQNAASFMNLADHDEELVTNRAWTEPQHIEQQLANLTQHMENVIQKYLRNQFKTIEDYNAQAGEIAEPYRVVVAFDFPVNFNEGAARRLVSIAQNGPRCGVYTVVLVDASKPMPHGFNLADLEQNATVIAMDGSRWVWQDPDYRDCQLELDAAPPPDLFNRILHTVGAGAKDAKKVEVPFERIAPPPDLWWRSDSRAGLTAVLGPSGARKTLSLELGKGTAQHVLVAGKTGSGKSTLLHTIITNLALAYSPDEVQLYLIDFKKGVEFKTYAAHYLPHARVIAIESEREFGLSVLQGLDAELKRRGDAFREAGVDGLADYRNKRRDDVLPRIMLLVDEFQEFFTEDDTIATQASQLLDRIVRQGRAFGMHVLLGSQTLAGSYALARSTIDQMAVRIALQCSDADSRLILSDDNPAARLLSRPGEAIYNASNGRLEGNNTFQVAFLSDDKRDGFLNRVSALAEAPGNKLRLTQAPIIFEGNAPGEIQQNRILRDALAGTRAAGTPLRAWLGDPIAIRDPISAQFRRQSGANVLIAGQNEAAATGILTASLISLAAQLQQQAKRRSLYYLLDFSQQDDPDAAGYAQFAGILTGLRIGKRRHLPEMIGELAVEMQARIDADAPANLPPLFLIVHGLHRARDLRAEDGFGMSGLGSFGDAPPAPSPAQQFATLLREGPEVGIHTLLWCDTLTNLNRMIDNRTLREFGMRVVFQMSESDSSNLIDSPVANRLGQFRALFYNEDEGRVEKFRPYGMPSAEWIEQIKPGL
jgi:energy-coupling factor transporter ATP-binding protein EcfA2